MELYRIWYKTENGCLPKYVLNTNPREAQKQFLQDNPNAEILVCKVDISNTDEVINLFNKTISNFD